ncbi:MAG: hypothetical protein ABI234_10320 [Ktedonobacteraceae bacterium]
MFLCLLAMLLTACDWGNSGSSGQHQALQTDNGSTVTYSTRSSDVLVRLFYGGGKVGTLELTPEISLYGDGMFITGPSLQLRQGGISNDDLQNLLHTLTGTDNLLQLHRQVFNDIPNQNAALLQVTLNDKKYQFVYGPFGHLQEGSQDRHEYQQLGDAIGAIQQALSHPTQAYTSPQSALLVHQTFREDFTENQNQTIPRWTLSRTLNLAHAAIYECGVVPADFTSPNLDLGCLNYTIPQLAILLDQQNSNLVENLLHGTPQQMFLENNDYYIVMLRPLLPDELAQHHVAMYGNNNQDYTPVPLKSGPIPVPTVTPRA